MKNWIFVVALLATVPVAAQTIYDQSGIGGLTYRNGDPFVFCRYGQKVADPCWWPAPDYTGNFIYNPSCDPPDEYGKSWTDDDWKSYFQYLAICPIAQKSGTWTGNGDGTNSPGSH